MYDYVKGHCCFLLHLSNSQQCMSDTHCSRKDVILEPNLKITTVVQWCLNASTWQQAGVTVINPFPLQACHYHNKATKPDAKTTHTSTVIITWPSNPQ